MEVKFTKDFRGKETKEVFYRAGEVAAVRDDHGARLIDLGFAVAYDSWEEVEKLPPPSLPVDPTLQTKPTATGEAAAIIQKDNAAILRNLQEAQKEEPPVVEAEPEPAPEPTPEPKPRKKSRK